LSAVRIAVIGAGRMGRLHAQKLAANPRARLVAVADPDAARARALAAELGCRAESTHRALLGELDAAVVAAPAAVHHAIAEDCLEAGLHLLVEKPLARSLAQADRLAELALRRGRVLQVGHIERYNPAFQALLAEGGQPLFIDAERLAPFQPRGTDVDVVLDLMIHDLDLTLALAPAPVEAVSASGFKVLSAATDIANARIEFAGGTVASVVASRVSREPLRKFRVFYRERYVSVDLRAQRLRVARAGEHALHEEDRVYGPADPLAAQTEAFLRAVAQGEPPEVGAEAGRQALALALAVMHAIGERQARHEGARLDAGGAVAS